MQVLNSLKPSFSSSFVLSFNTVVRPVIAHTFFGAENVVIE
jgi:hypothetical protein